MARADQQPQPSATATSELMEWISLLADDVGPRRPTSTAERRAAGLVAERLRERGVEASLEPFRGYSSFGLPFGLTLATAITPSLLPARRRRLRSALASLAAGALVSEGSLTTSPLTEALSRAPSQNVVATIEPRGPAERTLCLMAHLDSSRSGLIFHPRLVGLMGRWITLNSALVLAAAAAEPLLGGGRRGRRALASARGVLAAGLVLILERELRGEDVPGANDNASGCAVAARLATELAEDPPKSTRIVLCLTGCEEAGTLGSRAFLRAHDTSGWLFLNIDNVGGDGTVRYLAREGVITRWNADPGLVAVADSVAESRRELRMAPTDHPAGLTYDSSPVLAAGGRAITLSVQDGFIPDLHRPSDVTANVDPGGVERTFEAARAIAAAVDAGSADPA
jgi:peptidase M28-like protein